MKISCPVRKIGQKNRQIRAGPGSKLFRTSIQGVIKTHHLLHEYIAIEGKSPTQLAQPAHVRATHPTRPNLTDGKQVIDI